MRSFKYLFLAWAAASASAASAQTRGGFEIGAELFDYAYRERHEGQTIVRDDGTFFGMALGYTQPLGRSWFIRGKLMVSSGKADLRTAGGSLFDPDDPQFDPDLNTRIDGIAQDIGQFDLVAGRDFAIGGGSTVTPFAGIGVRLLMDHGGGRQSADGFMGYDREVAYHYIPVGVSAMMPLSGRTRLRLGAQYNIVVGGEAESFFSRLDPEIPDIEVDLDRGRGIAAEAILETAFGRRAISFGPFVRHWDIRRSRDFVLTDPEGSGGAIQFFEPRNRTTEVGLRIAIAF